MFLREALQLPPEVVWRLVDWAVADARAAFVAQGAHSQPGTVVVYTDADREQRLLERKRHGR